jgi:hypothetical protein
MSACWVLSQPPSCRSKLVFFVAHRTTSEAVCPEGRLEIQSIGDIVTEEQRILPAINLLARDKDRQEEAASCQEQGGGDTHLWSCRSIHSRSDQLSRTNVTTVTAASSENNSAISRNALAVNACTRSSRMGHPGGAQQHGRLHAVGGGGTAQDKDEAREYREQQKRGETQIKSVLVSSAFLSHAL